MSPDRTCCPASCLAILICSRTAGAYLTGNVNRASTSLTVYSAEAIAAGTASRTAAAGMTATSTAAAVASTRMDRLHQTSALATTRVGRLEQARFTFPVK